MTKTGKKEGCSNHGKRLLKYRPVIRPRKQREKAISFPFILYNSDIVQAEVAGLGSGLNGRSEGGKVVDLHNRERFSIDKGRERFGQKDKEFIVGHVVFQVVMGHPTSRCRHGTER